MSTTYRRLAARWVATVAGITAAVVGIRFAYEQADTANVVFAFTAACTFLAAFSLLLSAALGYGWRAGQQRADAWYEARMKASRPLGPVRYGAVLSGEVEFHAAEAEAEAHGRHAGHDAPEEWAQLLAAVTADNADLYAHEVAA